MTSTVTAPTTSVPVVPIDRSAFRVLLAELRADCVREREQALAESATSMPDAVALSRAGRLLRTVEEIDAALQRITDGTYGRCVRCGTDIPAERLEFRPFAAGCVACEERAR